MPRKAVSWGSSTAYVHYCVDADGVTQVHLSGSEHRPNSSINSSVLSAAVNTIKSLPSGKYKYNPETKTWFIDNEYWQIVHGFFVKGSLLYTLLPYTDEDSFEAFITGTRSVDKNVAWDGPANKAASDFFRNFKSAVVKTADTGLDKRLLAELLGVADFDRIPTDKAAAKRLYRAAALRLHPDKNNGDGYKMSELNRLWGAYVQPTL